MSQGGNNTYTIYRNDLKYKKERKLDMDKIIWSDDLRHLYENVDLDSLDYRLYECKKNEMAILDLNNMDLVAFPEIPKLFKDQIKCLFIAENDLETLPDLTDFKKLEILEIGNNNICDIGTLPTSLIEFCCRSNKLNCLPSIQECPNLERIDCTSNTIQEVPQYPKLKSLICSQNRITAILSMVNLEKLVCNYNNINYIENSAKLKYLDCSYNKLLKLNDYDNLVDLICSHNNLTELPLYRHVKYLEIFNTNIKCVPYMANLQELYCEKDIVRKISKKYVENCDVDIQVHKDSMLHIVFNKKNSYRNVKQ